MTESLKLREAAARRNCSRRSLWNAIHAGELPAHQLGGMGPWYVRVSDLDQWTPPDARARLRAYHEAKGHRVQPVGGARNVLLVLRSGAVVAAEIEAGSGAGLPLDAEFAGITARLDKNLCVYRQV